MGGAGTCLQSGLALTSFGSGGETPPFWGPGFFLCKRKVWVLESCAALNFQNCGSKRRPRPASVGLTFTGAPPALCSRHPVRHISFNSRRLITANVPYERVVRSADTDDFATHRRSVGCAGLGGVQKRQSSLILVTAPPATLFPTGCILRQPTNGCRGAVPACSRR